MRTLAAVVSLVLLLACAEASHALATAPAVYPLDGIARVLDPGQPLPCKSGAIELVTYTGERLRYQKPLLVHPAFRAQLRAFEELVDELARKHYGRAPKRIVHLGSYACRPMRRYPDWVSEHALGNAIDVAGFDFAPLARTAPLSAELPKALRRGFSVRLEQHWTGTGVAAAHARFLRDLAERLIARPDIFRVVLGPAWPGHKNHFHLDNAPYRVVEVF